MAIDLVEESEDEEDGNYKSERQMMATYHHKDINRIIKKADGWHYLDNSGKPSVKAMSVPPNTCAVSFYRELEKQGNQPSKVNSLASVFEKGIKQNNKTKEKLQKKKSRTNMITPTKGRDNVTNVAKQANEELWPPPREEWTQSEGKTKKEMKQQLFERKIQSEEEVKDISIASNATSKQTHKATEEPKDKVLTQQTIKEAIPKNTY